MCPANSKSRPVAKKNNEKGSEGETGRVLRGMAGKESQIKLVNKNLIDWSIFLLPVQIWEASRRNPLCQSTKKGLTFLDQEILNIL